MGLNKSAMKEDLKKLWTGMDMIGLDIVSDERDQPGCVIDRDDS